MSSDYNLHPSQPVKHENQENGQEQTKTHTGKLKGRSITPKSQEEPIRIPSFLPHASPNIPPNPISKMTPEIPDQTTSSAQPLESQRIDDTAPGEIHLEDIGPDTLKTAILYNQVSVVRQICRTMVDSNNIELLYNSLKLKPNEMNPHHSYLDYAKALGYDEIVNCFKEIGITKIINPAQTSPEFQARKRLNLLNAQLFDSYNFDIAANSGGPTASTLIDMVNELIEYRKTVLMDSDRDDITQVIQELRSALQMEALVRVSAEGNKSYKEPAAFALTLINALPEYDNTIPFQEAPCVIIPGAICNRNIRDHSYQGHAVAYKVQRDSVNNTFTFTKIDTDPVNSIEHLGNVEWKKINDVEYTGLRLDIETHPAGHSDKAVLNDVFLQKLLGYNYTPFENGQSLSSNIQLVNSWIETSLLKSDGANLKVGREHHRQRGKTCFSKVITSYLKKHLKCYAHFKYWKTKRMFEEMFAENGLSLWDIAQRSPAEIAKFPVALLKKCAIIIIKKRFLKALKETEQRDPATFHQLMNELQEEKRRTSHTQPIETKFDSFPVAQSTPSSSPIQKILGFVWTKMCGQLASTVSAARVQLLDEPPTGFAESLGW